MAHTLRFALMALAITSSEYAFAASIKKADLTTEQTAQNEDTKAPEGRGVFAPDWTPDSFDWSLGPILGVRARKTEYSGVEYDSVLSEAGIGTRIQGIPLIPGNPGITLEPYASYTWGNRTQKAKSDAIDETDSSGFQRHWYGAIGRFYYKAFRYSLDIGRGRINFDDKKYTDITASRFSNDLAFLILPHLSAHYTLTSYQVREDSHSKPAIDEFDQWLHARISFSLFKTSLDFGPGVTHTEYAGLNLLNNNYQKIATVDTNYLKALASMNIFWKLGLSGYAKFITDADDASGFNDTIDQLPNENLAESRSYAFLPKDSLEASLFFGLKDVLAGFGFGWQLYYLELKQDGGNKQISRDSGFVLTYDAGL
ncbi:MAG: hypothetical protein EOP10_09030 [Proteobacteria bacterium]|nr:MAG: hypothetical protein EOP10_09030 [Pseudomonadota bacterium]